MRLVTWLVVLSLGAATGAMGEITEQDMRDAGMSDEEIHEFWEKVEKLEAEGRVWPTAEEYLAGGRSQEGALTARIANDEQRGLEIARQIIRQTEQREVSWPNYAVLNGLSKRSSPEVLEVFEEFAARRGSESVFWAYSRRGWAAAFHRLHGDEAFDLAAERVADTTLSAEQRALYLFVLMRVGWRGDSSRRAAALQRYRPYLQAPEPELQRAAVYAARTLNDYAVRDEIEHISWTSADWKARSMARILFKAFLTVGPDPDVWPKVNGVPIGMYDPEGLRAYRASRPEWEAEFHRLRTGEDAPPGWPNVQPMERDPAQSQPSGGGSRRSLGSP